MHAPTNKQTTQRKNKPTNEQIKERNERMNEEWKETKSWDDAQNTHDGSV